MARRYVRFSTAVRGASGVAILAEQAEAAILDLGGSPLTWYPTQVGGVGSTLPIRSNDVGEVEAWIDANVSDVVRLDVSSDGLTVQAGTGIPLSFPDFTDYLPAPAPFPLAPDLLANRPSAVGLLDGTTFLATDAGNGTPYVVDGGAWRQNGASVDAPSGHVLASAWPSAVAAQTVDANSQGIWPELVTPQFTWPAEPVRVFAGGCQVNTNNAGSALRLDYSVDDGATWLLAKVIGYLSYSGGIASFPASYTRVPYPGASVPHTPVVGNATMRCRLSLTGGTVGASVQPVVFSLVGANVGLDVVSL